MIDLPLDFVIESIADCCFIRFKDINHAPGAPPHYYFLIPWKDASKTVYIISIVTSKFEKRLYYYQNTPNPKATQSLVRLEKGVFSFITKESAIDCNKAEKLTKRDLLKRIDKNTGMTIEKRGVDSELKEKIVYAIMNSPLVPPVLKSYLRNSR